MADNLQGRYIKITTNQTFVKAFGSINGTTSTIMLMNQSDQQENFIATNF